MLQVSKSTTLDVDHYIEMAQSADYSRRESVADAMKKSTALTEALPISVLERLAADNQSKDTRLKIVFNEMAVGRLSKESIIRFINDDLMVCYVTLSKPEATSKLSAQELLDAVDRIIIKSEKGYISASCILENQDALNRLPEEILKKLEEIPKPELLTKREIKSRFKFPRKRTIAEYAWHIMGAGNDQIRDLVGLLIKDKITDDDALKISKKITAYRGYSTGKLLRKNKYDLQRK